jgi:DNA-directed RNA polymerase subunit beta
MFGQKLSYAINNAAGEQVVAQGKKITNSVFREMTKQGITEAEIAPNDIQGAYVAADVIDMSTGEVLIEANHEINETGFNKLMEAGIETVDVFFPERDDAGNVISVTLRKTR